MRHRKCSRRQIASELSFSAHRSEFRESRKKRAKNKGYPLTHEHHLQLSLSFSLQGFNAIFYDKASQIMKLLFF